MVADQHGIGNISRKGRMKSMWDLPITVPNDTLKAVQPKPIKVEDVVESSESLVARKRVLMVCPDEVKICCSMTCAYRRRFDRSKNFWNLTSARVTVLKEGGSRRSDVNWYSWVGSLTWCEVVTPMAMHVLMRVEWKEAIGLKSCQFWNMNRSQVGLGWAC